VLFIITLYFKLEDKQITTKELSLIAIYSTFTAIARVPFNVIPNFTPCDFLIFCAGYVFGPLIGFIIGGNTAIISNLFLGQGPWTIYQIVAWGLVGVTGGLLNPKHNQIPNRFFIAIVGFIWGFVYGWITNIWFWLLNPPISLTTFIATNILSFPFDLLHAIASFIFLFAFGIPTINILYRYRQRFVINRVELPIVQELG
jgi:energy-coupling factor transport system substrate-specific component